MTFPDNDTRSKVQDMRPWWLTAATVNYETTPNHFRCVRSCRWSFAANSPVLHGFDSAWRSFGYSRRFGYRPDRRSRPHWSCRSLLECERRGTPGAGEGRNHRDVVLQLRRCGGSRLGRHSPGTPQSYDLADDRFAPRTWRVVPGQSPV